MKTLLVSSVIALLVVSSYWVWTNYLKITGEILQVSEHFPDYFVENFSLTSTDKHGRIAYNLTGSRLVHFNDTLEASVSNPVLQFRKGAQTWEIRALHGELGKDQHTLRLHDNVVAVRKNASGFTTLKINTGHLQVDTQSKSASTEDEVQLHTGNLTLNSTGLDYNGQTGVFKLLSSARGVYEIQQ